jgi:hypothetical protein
LARGPRPHQCPQRKSKGTLLTNGLLSTIGRSVLASAGGYAGAITPKKRDLIQSSFHLTDASAECGAHKALRRCALEKNTRCARVGGAEGAKGDYTVPRVTSVFGLAPFQGGAVWAGFPGLKPRAESYSPFGALNLPSIP